MNINLLNKTALIGASTQRLGFASTFNLVAFLTSDYASYITRTSIPVDGGLSEAY